MRDLFSGACAAALGNAPPNLKDATIPPLPPMKNFWCFPEMVLVDPAQHPLDHKYLTSKGLCAPGTPLVFFVVIIYSLICKILITSRGMETYCCSLLQQKEQPSWIVRTAIETGVLKTLRTLTDFDAEDEEEVSPSGDPSAPKHHTTVPKPEPMDTSAATATSPPPAPINENIAPPRSFQEVQGQQAQILQNLQSQQAASMQALNSLLQSARQHQQNLQQASPRVTFQPNPSSGPPPTSPPTQNPTPVQQQPQPKPQPSFTAKPNTTSPPNSGQVSGHTQPVTGQVLPNNTLDDSTVAEQA